MEIVIDIDENVYTRLFDNGVDTSLEDRKVIDRAVRNGTPLPKGHGRLIDADELLLKSAWYGESFTFDNPMPNENEAVSVEDIENALTIIEADKEAYTPKPTSVRPIKPPMYRSELNVQTGTLTFIRDDENGKFTEDDIKRWYKE